MTKTSPITKTQPNGNFDPPMAGASTKPKVKRRARKLLATKRVGAEQHAM